jgi:hypothetical protein
MSQNNKILLLLGLGALGYLVAGSSPKKEGFRFQQVGNAVTAQPTLPANAVPPRSDNLGLTQGGGLGFNQSPSLQVGAIPPTSSPLTSANPNFATLGSVGQQNLLNKGNFLTSQQVSDLVGGGSPTLQQQQLPNPDMKYSGGLDPTDPNNFIYDRTLFARLKRRNRNDVDYFRGDIDVTPEYRGWFDIRPPSDVDKVTGYFDRYIDIEQETALRDAIFTRNTPAEELAAAKNNPYGDVGRLVNANI